MYLRWKRRWRRRQQAWAYYAEVVTSTWQGGQARQRVVGYLASVRAPYLTAPAHRQRVWAQATARLAALGLDAATQQRLLAQLAQRVPRPSATELAALAAQHAALGVTRGAPLPSCRHSGSSAKPAARGAPPPGGPHGPAYASAPAH